MRDQEFDDLHPPLKARESRAVRALRQSRRRPHTPASERPVTSPSGAPVEVNHSVVVRIQALSEVDVRFRCHDPSDVPSPYKVGHICGGTPGCLPRSWPLVSLVVRHPAVSYQHNAEADFAASELARLFAADPGFCYEDSTKPAAISASASYEPSSSPWPKADGLITLLESGATIQRDIALEYKTPQEGAHGLLTAMGQAYSYLHKGYNGAVIVVPKQYPSHNAPGPYLASALDFIEGSKAIGVFHYETPDTTSPTPFAGRLTCVRSLELVTSPTTASPVSTRPTTQWVHMREGSTTRDGFFRFLQAAKQLSAGSPNPAPSIPQELSDAILRIAPGSNATEYLSNISNTSLLSRTWSRFWFEWIVTPAVLTPWIKVDSTYSTPSAQTGIRKDDDSGYSMIFEGRVNGLKETLVAELNAGRITEDQAWEYFASGINVVGGPNKQGIRERAHSYREDMDSALSQLEWIDAGGLPSDQGYRYMTLCERYGGANSSAAIEYFGATLLQTGRYAGFLHYLYRLSERKFAANPLAFADNDPIHGWTFNELSYKAYLTFIEDALTNDLKVIRKVSGRSRPRTRTPFQVELTLLRSYGFISKQRYRLGVGIPIDWERVLGALNVEL